MYLTHEVIFFGPWSRSSFWPKTLEKTSLLPKGDFYDRITAKARAKI